MASLATLLLEVGALIVLYRVCTGGWDAWTLFNLGPSLYPGQEILGVPIAVSGMGVLMTCSIMLIFIITTLLFQTALVSCVVAILEGGDGSILTGLQAAGRNLHRILGFAILSLLVKLSIDHLANIIPGLGGRIVAWLGGATWAVATFLVLPVLVIEKQALGASFKKAAALFRSTWDDQLKVRVGFGLFELVLLLGYGLLCVTVLVVTMIAFRSAGWPGALTGVIGTVVSLEVLGLVLLLLVLSSLQPIFSAVLYSYAVTGMLPEEIAPDLIPPRRTA